MKKETIDVGPNTTEFPKLADKIEGRAVWRVANYLGKRVFGKVVYFNVIAPEDPHSDMNGGLYPSLYGRLCTWAESAFEEKRAEATKSIIRAIFREEFANEERNFRESLSDLMKD